MSILYPEEHIQCIHYQKDPLVKLWSLKKGQRFEFGIRRESAFLFIRKGCLSVTYAGHSNVCIEENRVLLLPLNNNYVIDAESDVELLLFVFDVQVTMCEDFSLAQLFSYCATKKKKNTELCTLALNQQMHDYLHTLTQYVTDAVDCIHLYHLKKQELFILFRLYYSKELLALFFDPILNKRDLFFKKKIMENCFSVKNVQELAALLNYSPSGFIKKFERCFGESPYKWICNYKATHILKEIKGEKLSFKEICEKYYFSSMPHFIQFCKKQYGITPGKLRKVGKNT